MGSVYAIAGFLALILLVVIPIHELGHMLVARRFGFKVTEYFIGFGPRLWSTETRRDRVRRQGDPGRRLREDRRDEPVRVGGARGPATRLWVQADLAAGAGDPRGPASHFLVGALLYFVLFATYGNLDTNVVVVGDVAQTLAGDVSPAKEAGLQVGDVVVRVGDMPNPTPDSLGRYVTRYAGSTRTSLSRTWWNATDGRSRCGSCRSSSPRTG